MGNDKVVAVLVDAGFFVGAVKANKYRPFSASNLAERAALEDSDAAGSHEERRARVAAVHEAARDHLSRLNGRLSERLELRKLIGRYCAHPDGFRRCVRSLV